MFYYCSKQINNIYINKDYEETLFLCQSRPGGMDDLLR